MKIPRFPPIQKRPDGSAGCRGCGGDIPPGRKTWCSQACHEKYNPFYVKIAVAKRCNHKCEKCGKDCSRQAQREYAATRPTAPCYSRECKLPYPYNYEAYKAHPLYLAYQIALKSYNHRYPAPEFDHIVPHCEGGPFTVENIRLLCTACHKARTAEWHKSRKHEAA